MNQIYSGSTLLGVVLLITLALFALAFFFKPKTSDYNASNQGKKSNSRNKATSSYMFKSKPGAFAKPNTKRTSKPVSKPDSIRQKLKSEFFGLKKGKGVKRAVTYKNASKTQLIKLKRKVSKHFPDLNAILREQHLVLERNAKKVAMLTVDANAALGRRRLGDITVINFHELPSVEELKIELSGV